MLIENNKISLGSKTQEVSTSIGSIILESNDTSFVKTITPGTIGDYIKIVGTINELFGLVVSTPETITTVINLTNGTGRKIITSGGEKKFVVEVSNATESSVELTFKKEGRNTTGRIDYSDVKVYRERNVITLSGNVYITGNLFVDGKVVSNN